MPEAARDNIADDTPNMLRAQAEAVALAREHLRGADLARAAEVGGLPRGADGCVEAAVLGRALKVMPGTLAVTAPDGAPVHVVEELLVLRYLGADREVRPRGELITFRDMPGGNFYLQPILNRTSNIVLGVFGNNMPWLATALEAFPHERLDLGDLSASVRAVGRLDLVLVYRLGDDEFPATLDILFDRALASVYRIDEAAALANRLCMGIVRRKPGKARP
jgi:hypothetical protein